jgi:hypothetical protein
MHKPIALIRFLIKEYPIQMQKDFSIPQITAGLKHLIGTAKRILARI